MKRLLPTFCGLALLGGCAVGPDYRPPKVPVPGQWHAAAVEKPAGSRPEVWWKTFDDPILNRLINEAVTANLDLQQAAARIRDARAQKTIAVAAALPQVNSRSNLSRRSNNFASSGTGTSAGGFGIGNQIINIFQAGFDAQWELDLFGGIRRGIEAADATVEAEVENRRDIQVSLLAEVARRYVELRGNQQLIAVTTENLRAQSDTLELTRARQQAGLAAMLEVAQQEAQVAATAAQLPDYEAAAKQAIHAIGVLLGREPGALAHLLEALRPLPTAPAGTVTELPSELLRRRPDIRRAERQLAAATAQIGVATAELYPKFNLAAFLGIQNTRITDISPLGKSWSAAASIAMPIFNWGKLQANIRSREAQQDEILLAYRSTILTALREVEDALVAHAQDQARGRSLAEAVEANQLAVQLANERYLKGLTGFLDVLESQRALLLAQSALVQNRLKTQGDLIALYKALGGGWDMQPGSSAGEETGRTPAG